MKLFCFFGICLGILTSCVGGQPGVDPQSVFPIISQDDINNGAYRDDVLFSIGAFGFDRNWTCGEGGGSVRNGVCVYDRRLGPETSSCLDCHNWPVRDGAGQQSNNITRMFSADGTQFITRSPPHVFGVSYVELLAREMTAELALQRDAAIQQAQASAAPVTVNLTAKGQDFGQLSVDPSGNPTYLGNAVTADLQVRPFGIKGTFFGIRQQNINAFINHLGLEAEEMLALNNFPPDHDLDGVVNEVTPGQLSAIVAYQVLLPVPSFVPVSSHATDGAAIFTAIGCASCHTPMLRLEDPSFPLPDPFGNADTPTMVLSPLDHGERPQLTRTAPNGPILVPLFSDLRRHDLGDGTADYKDIPVKPNPLSTGMLPMVPKRFFLSTRLWGVGSTGPYLHDGSAINLDQAIKRHGGEADGSRTGYLGLSADDQQSLLDFLNSLILQRDQPSQPLPNLPGGSY